MLGPVLLLSDTFGLMLLLVSCRPDQVESLCGWDCSWSNLDWISNVLSLVSLIDTLTNDNCLSIQHLLSRMMSAMTRYSWVFCFLTLMVSWQLYSQEPHPEGNVSLLFYKWIAFMGYFCISELFFCIYESNCLMGRTCPSTLTQVHSGLDPVVCCSSQACVLVSGPDGSGGPPLGLSEENPLIAAVSQFQYNYFLWFPLLK